jgi:hypothetical protein
MSVLTKEQVGKYAALELAPIDTILIQGLVKMTALASRDVISQVRWSP